MPSSIVVPGETGLLANSVDEWTLALQWLASDQESTRKLDLQGRKRVEAAYSLQILASRFG